MPNIVTTILGVIGEKADLDKFVNETVGYDEEADNTIFKFDSVIPLPDIPQKPGMSKEEKFDAHVELMKKTWGCYRGPFKTEVKYWSSGDGLTVEIETGWTAPVKIFEKLPEKYPTLEFHAEYYDEEVFYVDWAAQLLVDALVGDDARDTNGNRPTEGCIREIMRELHDLVIRMKNRFKESAPAEIVDHISLLRADEDTSPMDKDFCEYRKMGAFKAMNIADDEFYVFLRDLDTIDICTERFYWDPVNGESPTEECHRKNREDKDLFFRSVKRRIPSLKMFSDMDKQKEKSA